MLLTHLFENKHMTEADIASVNWNTDSKQDKLNEFAPGAGGDDEAGDDPYKYPKPERYRRSADYFGQFEADHFDREDFDDATGEFKGYWGDKQIAYFKFDNPIKTSSDDSGRGWYYEPQSGNSGNNTSAEPAVDNADERKQQELDMIRAFLKSGNRPSPGSQIYNLMKRHGVTEGQDNPYGYRKGQTVKLNNGTQGRVIDIFDDSIEVLLVGGRTVTVDFRDAQVIDEQGVAEDSEDTVSFREMVDVVDKHYPKYYAELSGSNISDKQFEQKITSAYKKIMQKQGVAEKLGDNRPKLGSKRDQGKSVRKWRQARGLDESGVAEASNELAAMTPMGMGDPLDFSSDYALYTVQKGRELFGTMRNLYAKANALPPAERSKFYQRLDALAYEGLGDEILRYSKTLTVDDLVAITDVLENYDIMFNTIAIPDELKDAEAAWKQYAAEVALARTQAQPGQTMHERSMAGDSENAFAPVKLHDQQSNTYGDAILDIADQFEDKFADDKASEYATAIATVGHAFLNNGMRSGRARLFGLEQAVYKHVLMALDQQGLNIVKDLIRPHFNPDGRIPFNKMSEGDISQLEKDVADAPVEPIANMEAKEKVGNMDADAFDAAMARLKKLAGAGPMKTVWDPARRVYKNVPTAVQPKK
jgi:hypothetical protein